MFRLAFGISCVCICAFAFASSLGVIPDADKLSRESHVMICDAVAVQCAAALQIEDMGTLGSVLSAIRLRNPEIQSIGLRADGKLVLSAGDHESGWDADAASDGMFQCRAPLILQQGAWGDLEVRFTRASDSLWKSASRSAWAPFVVLFAACLVGVYGYLRVAFRWSQQTSDIPKRVRDTFEAVAEGVLILDKQRRIRFANRTFAQKAGMTPDELTKMRVDDLPWLGLTSQRDGGAPVWLETIERRVAHLGRHLTLAPARSDPMNFSVNATPILSDDGECKGVLATFDDLTPLESKNAELRRILHQLRTSRQKIRSQAKDLKKAKATAEAANEAKSNFLANVSHEIRTPMNTILGMADLALEMKLPPSQKESFELIRVAGESLMELINELLDMSKIEAGKFTLEEIAFSPRQTLYDVVRLLAIRAHKQGLELCCDVDPSLPAGVVGDPVRLRQILINLIGNALKFTQKGHIVVRVAREADVEPGVAHVRFTVEDTGIGIEADKFDAIFQPFVQADGSTTRKYGGTGLGLAICWQLVELMGGRLWVDSEVGRGSMFHFVLPLRIGGDATPAPALPNSVADHVLVVRPNDTARSITRRFLEGLGFRCDDCATTMEAAELVQQARQKEEPFGLLLLDMSVGFDSAQDFLQCARAMQPEPFCTILLTPANADRETLERYSSIGVKTHLVKPVLEPSLVNALRAEFGANATEEAAEPATQAVANAEPAPRLRFLLVDDNPFNRKIGTLKLEAKGHDVVTAASGEEALAVLRNVSFDMVLMDMQMPGLDGRETTRQLRQEEEEFGMRTPVIAMTAQGLHEIRAEMEALEMDGYVAKPIRDDELWRAVSVALKIDLASLLRGSRPEPATSAEQPADGATPVHSPQSSSPSSDPAVGSEAAASPVPIWSYEQTLERVDGNVGLLRDLFTAFHQDSLALLKDLDASLDQTDAEKLRISAHTLKGMLGFFEAHSLVAVARQLEHLGRDRSFVGAPELRTTLSDGVRTLCVDVERTLSPER